MSARTFAEPLGRSETNALAANNSKFLPRKRTKVQASDLPGCLGSTTAAGCFVLPADKSFRQSQSSHNGDSSWNATGGLAGFGKAADVAVKRLRPVVNLLLVT